MTTIDVQVLQEQTTEVLRRIHEGKEVIEIVHQGQLIARLTLANTRDTAVQPNADTWEEQAETIWPGLSQLKEDISAHWPEGVSALEAVHDVRREL